MKVLFFGGTRFFGVHAVNYLLAAGHDVTIATRGLTADSFGTAVNRLVIDRNNRQQLAQVLGEKYFDVIVDNLAYSSNDVRNLLDAIQPARYVITSTMSVYRDLHLETTEADYDPLSHDLIWCERDTFTYDEVKRQAEAALFQKYAATRSVAVRYPYVIGNDDYTKRLYFYVEHVIKQQAMFVDSLDVQFAFVSADEAGQFLSFLATADFVGPINGASFGTITLGEIISYVEQKCGKAVVLDEAGDGAPYNGTPSYSLPANLAKEIGFAFSEVGDWIYGLLDELIEQVQKDL
ncbi:NAD-dependent epimerase/dehydratase family protein [Culicoidibacter larvae]|uniref:UDP-glucose 4-epimerase n=1 Tax=Culicoidibacter larvae TaxID=2579976 RepID=A0A5R8QDK6_9FIRM|nr:NAD-dependent epimerase/dehydratase family protein [Culicoidibacter larvae]TLG75284.1 NAD-dependent epimerase [Culicoidibacter larvae]